MNENFLSKENVRKILWIAFIIILMTAGFLKLGSIGAFLKKVLDIFMPFVLGACIAFIFNVPLNGIEKGLFKNKEFKGKRPISYLITLILVLGVIAAAVSVIIPRVVDTAKSIAANLSFDQIEALRDIIVARFPFLKGPLERFDLSYEAIITYVTDLFSGESSLFGENSSMVSSVGNAVSSVASGVASTLIGFAFSVYVLFKKEALGVQARQVTYALFSKPHADKILDVASLSYRTFANFIKGQFLEACILGCMFFITMSIFRLPYALMISVMIAITALIPVFGAFLGCGIGFLLILVVSPKEAFLFVALFLILQQIEGKLIYPHVVGSSVGLPSVWVLMAITVGAEIMGVAGMLLFVPFCSVLYALFRRFILDRLANKQVEPENYLVPYSERVPDTYAPSEQPKKERGSVPAQTLFEKIFADRTSRRK